MAEQSIGELMRELSEGSRTLVKQEIQLARAELAESLRNAKKGLAWVVVAVVPVLMALVALSNAAIDALATALPRWAAALIVGGIFLAIAAGLAWAGFTYLRKSTPVAQKTAQTVREDVEWMRDRLS
jgi:uncharacterized membrane protein YqjE